jgi:hypothetical protein
VQKRRIKMKKNWLFPALLFLAAALGASAQSTGVITITVTNAAANITVDRACNRVLVRENSASPTAVFSITLSGTSTAQNFPAGSQYLIVNPSGNNWPSGTTIATIVATAAGPFTFTGTETVGPGPQTVNNSASGGGSGSGVTAVTATPPVASSGGTTPVISCPTCSTSAPDLTAEYIIGATDSNLTNALVWPTLYKSIDAPPASELTPSDEFDEASLSGSWTWLNQGSATATVANGYLLLAADTTSANERIIYQAAPSTPWTIVMKSRFMRGMGSSGSGNVEQWAGIILEDSISGKFVGINWRNDSGGGLGLQVAEQSSVTSTGYSQVYNSGTLTTAEPGCYKVQDDGTNLNFSYSLDCNGFVKFYSQGRTAYLTNGANRVGIDIDNFGGAASPGVLSVDYFRRTQ